MKLRLYYATMVGSQIYQLTKLFVVQIVQFYNSNLYPLHACIIIINTSCKLDPQIDSD